MPPMPMAPVLFNSPTSVVPLGNPLCIYLLVQHKLACFVLFIPLFVNTDTRHLSGRFLLRHRCTSCFSSLHYSTLWIRFRKTQKPALWWRLYRLKTTMEQMILLLQMQLHVYAIRLASCFLCLLAFPVLSLLALYRACTLITPLAFLGFTMCAKCPSV